MDSVKPNKKAPLPKVKRAAPPPPPSVKTPKSRSVAFAMAGRKFKKLGSDWRFSNGATLVQDQEPDLTNIGKIARFMETHKGTNVTVTIASILKGAK